MDVSGTGHGHNPQDAPVAAVGQEIRVGVQPLPYVPDPSPRSPM